MICALHFKIPYLPIPNANAFFLRIPIFLGLQSGSYFAGSIYCMLHKVILRLLKAPSQFLSHISVHSEKGALYQD